MKIEQTKKLDKMFLLLIEQNQEVQKQIMNYREKFKQQKEPEENKQIFDLENGGRNNMSGDPLRISGSQSHHLNTLKKIQNPRSPITGQGIKPI